MIKESPIRFEPVYELSQRRGPIIRHRLEPKLYASHMTDTSIL